jgi:release factor glutamine methyltransferase
MTTPLGPIQGIVAIERVHGYVHLRKDDLEPPTTAHVFFDPADTEVGAWLGADLLTPGGTVIDLACASGAAAAAMGRAGAGHAYGVDIAAESVAWARARYGCTIPGRQVSFVVGDFVAMSSEELRRACPADPPPSVLTSNPAYVPLRGAGPFPLSIDGGRDGLRFAPAIVGHARALRVDLGLTLGSYSSPERAAELVDDAGFCIEGLTLVALPLGPFTRAHPEAIRDLVSAGRAALWRDGQETPGYLIVGMTCRRRTSRCVRPHASPAEVFAIVSAACASHGPELEALDPLVAAGRVVIPLRVLVLPDPSTRQHW